MILDNLTSRNSYKIAINFNKQIIKNLNENSKLYIPFLQLNSYVLFNYHINANSYTFSLEPLILTKNHLLSSYDKFIFTYKEKVDHLQLESQNILNDLTAINEYNLFPLNINCDSKFLLENDFAVPISIEMLHEIHERNIHLKSNKMNRTKIGNNSLYFYTRKSLKKIEEAYKKINKKDEGEQGLLIQYFIKYKDKENKIIQKLKKNHYLGNIIQNVKLFTSRNFKDLKEEIDKIYNKQKINNQFPNGGNKDKNEILIDDDISPRDKNTQNSDENESQKDSLSYYEKNYLFNGKYFVYPDSIPFNYVTIIGRKKNSDSNNDKKISEGKEKYLKKYEKAIIEGRKSHYGEDN